MAPGPYGLLAHMFFAPLMTFRMVVLGSPAGSPSVIAITCTINMAKHCEDQRANIRWDCA